MRVLLFLLFWAATTGAASASSFVVIAAPEKKLTGSMVIVGPPATAAVATHADAPFGIDPTVTLSYPFVEGEPPREISIVPPPANLKRISPSVLSMDMPRVAPAREKQPPLLQPMVFREGIVGDAFATPAGPVEAEPGEPAQPASAPEAATGGKAPQPAGASQPAEEPTPVAPPSPSPALPTRAPE